MVNINLCPEVLKEDVDTIKKKGVELFCVIVITKLFASLCQFSPSYITIIRKHGRWYAHLGLWWRMCWACLVYQLWTWRIREGNSTFPNWNFSNAFVLDSFSVVVNVTPDLWTEAAYFKFAWIVFIAHFEISGIRRDVLEDSANAAQFEEFLMPAEMWIELVLQNEISTHILLFNYKETSGA